MGSRREIELRLVPPLPRDHVVLVRLSDRHRFVKEVRHLEEQQVQLLLDGVRHLERSLGFVRHPAELLFQTLVARLGELFGKAVLLRFDRFRLVQMRPPTLIELEDLVDRRLLAFQLRGPAHPIRVAADQLEREHYVSAFMTGNRITSLTEGWSVSSMTRRSMPTPSPPHGGSPYSTARRKSSSIG